MHHSGIGSEREKHLRSQYHPMPFMQAQIERVDLAERKEQHKEDPPGQGRLEGQKELVADCTDQHREPQSIRIKQTFDI